MEGLELGQRVQISVFVVKSLAANDVVATIEAAADTDTLFSILKQ